MELKIDGIPVVAGAGQSLRDLLVKLNLDGKTMADRPIAAKVSGEIFNLNYIPVRQKDLQNERISVRRAMEASDGIIQLIRYRDPAGKAVYTRTAQFVIFLALHRLYPGIRAKMNCMVGNALYIEVQSSDFSAADLKKEVCSVINKDVILSRRRMPLDKAIAHFEASHQIDKSQLLRLRSENYFDVYEFEDFRDYYYGELAPSTGYLQVWDILPVDGGFMFLFPDDISPNDVAKYAEMPKFLNVCLEGERWCELMHCETVADLNQMVANGKIRELIRVNEALHEKQFSRVADLICCSGAKAVMLSGPSSSGKTTSANRLATQLRVHGKNPVLISLDDYYIDRDKILPGPDGTVDLEHINTIDVDLFRMHLEKLLLGEDVLMPLFDFKEGKRQWHSKPMRMTDDSIIIVEGLHALNPRLLPKDIPAELVFKMYVSPLIPLNLDDHNRIPTSFIRLLRRIVRDYESRGASVQKTLSMWDSVRNGEKRWIYPYQENADIIFNSSTLYEPVILKRHIYPLLAAIQPEDSCYEEVRGLVKVLNYVCAADVDDEIPPTSIVREFIGGNSFYK